MNFSRLIPCILSKISFHGLVHLLVIHAFSRLGFLDDFGFVSFMGA